MPLVHLQPFQLRQLPSLGVEAPKGVAAQNERGGDMQHIIGAKAMLRRMPVNQVIIQIIQKTRIRLPDGQLLPLLNFKLKTRLRSPGSSDSHGVAWTAVVRFINEALKGIHQLMVKQSRDWKRFVGSLRPLIQQPVGLPREWQMNPNVFASTQSPHFAPKAKRIIWLTQAGAPSQLDLFDYKPGLASQFDKDLPESIRNGQRLTGMTAGQKRFPIAPSVFKFQQHGQSGMWLSELLPHTAKFADDICVIRSLHTEAINHDPAMTLLQTGHQIGGRPSFGSWVSYGLGSENSDLPAFVAMISRPSGPTNAQPLHERMWGAGFLPSRYQGVRFNSGKDPVLVSVESARHHDRGTPRDAR
jgi:hypothetical protein